MNKYARIIDGTVVEIIEPIEGITIEQRYSDDFVKTLIQSPDNVIEGWLYDGAKFTKPIIEEPAIVNILLPLTARQFWQAALVIGVTEEGLTADVSNPESPLFVKDDAERESVLIDIKKTTQFSRDHYLIEKLTTAKDIPTEQLDSLWQWASQIQ